MSDNDDNWITVLNDDETYGGLDGSWIAETNAEMGQLLDEQDYRPGNIIAKRYDLRKLLNWARERGFFTDENADIYEVEKIENDSV